MRKLGYRRYFIALVIGVLAPMFSFAQKMESKGPTNEEIIYDSYGEYIQASKDYIDTQKEMTSQIRDWRKKRLAEIFDEKLEVTEQNLLLSNSNLIEEFNKFLKQNGVDSLDDVLLIRLAQLYFEKANLEFNHQMKLAQQGGGRGEIPVPNYKKAILFSKLFAAKFPNSAIGDKAYYLVGFATEEMGKPSQSVTSYESLLAKYPASEYAEEVAWRLGEIYYSQGQYAKAEGMYLQLSKSKGTFYTKAMYKLGATYFVEKKLNESVAIFETLVGEISKIKDNSLEDQSIADESLDYLATLLSNNNNIKISQEYQPEVYYRLGLLYKKRLDEKSMRVVYAVATQKFPYARQLPSMYSELIESSENAQDTEKANAYRSQFVQILTKDQKWWNENENYKNVLFQTQDLLEFNLIKSAEYYAEKGYSRNDSGQLKIAKDRYYNFITEYPWSTYKDYAKLELADLEYFLGNYPKASEYYFQIVSEATSPTLQEEAAYSLIWSEVKKVGYNLNFESKNTVPQNLQKIKLDPTEKVFSQAAIFYISKIKSSSRKNKVIYKLAELYAEHGDFDSSTQYLNMIISDTQNTTDTTVKAYRFLAEIFNIKNDWASVVSVNELADSTFFGGEIESIDKENYRQKYRDKLEAAYNFEFNEKYLDAAHALEKIIIQNPRSPMNDFLNLKIAGFYIRVGQYDRAQGICNLLSNTKFKAEAQFLSAEILYKTVRIEEAAKSLENFVLNNRKHPWFEQALLNIVSMRNQTHTEEKTVGLFKKLNPQNLSSYAYYNFIQSLLVTKKYDDLYKAVNWTRGKSKYDGYRMQYFALKAQDERYDYVGLERICSNLEKVFNQTQMRSAYVNLNKSFCEYAKLKTVLGQTESSLEDIVSRLNSIYSNKVDSVTTLAMQAILTKSDLRNQFKTQFEQLIKKSWSIAKSYPLSPTTEKLSQAILNYTGRLPLSLSYMINWRAGLGDIFDFQSIPDEDVKLKCESKQYGDCLAGLKEIFKTNRSNALYENLIVASLKLNDDEELQNWVTGYLKDSNSSERSMIFAQYLGMSDKIPAGKSIQLTEADPFGLGAKALEHWKNKEYKDAIDLLLNAMKEDSASVYPYYVLAQIYYERGFPELARTVATNGYDNTESKGLLPVMYQLNAVTFSTTSASGAEIRRDLSPAVSFALAFAFIKNKDSKSLDKVYQVVKIHKDWFKAIKTLELVYTDSKNFKPDTRNKNLYTEWLQTLFKLSKGQEEFSLDKVSEIAQKNQAVPNYSEIERIISNREVAGEKK